MAKWADFLISHVKKNSFGKITHVVIHTDNGDTVSLGEEKSESEVIRLLKAGCTIKTIIWSYPAWTIGATVSIVKGAGGEFLRTDRDKTAKDNLDNLIPMYT
ncbi:MAG: DUF3892 domain-containing protein [Bacteroidetes bacterium]|nr:DUF3892 domain-containing protein [Bacteroidota bacterium]